MANHIPEKSRTRVHARDLNRCANCRRTLPSGERHWHHRRSRSVRDDHTHCPCNGVTLCGTCHKWVHDHPFEARALGLIVSRHSVPCDEPMEHQQHGLVLLTCEGTVDDQFPDEEKEA